MVTRVIEITFTMALLYFVLTNAGAFSTVATAAQNAVSGSINVLRGPKGK